MSGIVKDPASMNVLQNSHSIGDILTLEVCEEYRSDQPGEMGRRPIISLTIPKSQLNNEMFTQNLMSCLGDAKTGRLSPQENRPKANSSLQEVGGFYFGLDQSSLVKKIDYPTSSEKKGDSCKWRKESGPEFSYTTRHSQGSFKEKEKDSYHPKGGIYVEKSKLGYVRKG